MVLMRASLLTVCALLVAAPCVSAGAQTTDFTMTPGAFTAPNPNNFIGFGVWAHMPGTGWTVNGRNRESARLVSNVFTATGGALSLSFQHSFNFQLNLFGGCFDGGLLLANVNGAGFTPVAPTVSPSSVGYRGPISLTNGSARAGENAFCGFPNNQAGTFVSSLFQGSAAAGSTVQFAFEGVWDNSTVNSGANWIVRNVTTSGLTPATVVPEPSTYALLLGGLAWVAVIARGRRPSAQAASARRA
jgi:hypothetical protein